jgi:predicted nucleic acid-binding protein
VIAEIKLGIEQIRRRDGSQAGVLDRWLARMRKEFEGRILPVTEAVAEEWSHFNVPDRMQAIDSLIAATAKVHGLVLVTRNSRDFARTKVSLLNPFVR